MPPFLIVLEFIYGFEKVVSFLKKSWFVYKSIKIFWSKNICLSTTTDWPPQIDYPWPCPHRLLYGCLLISVVCPLLMPDRTHLKSKNYWSLFKLSCWCKAIAGDCFKWLNQRAVISTRSDKSRGNQLFVRLLKLWCNRNAATTLHILVGEFFQKSFLRPWIFKFFPSFFFINCRICSFRWPDILGAFNHTKWFEFIARWPLIPHNCNPLLHKQTFPVTNANRKGCLIGEFGTCFARQTNRIS